MPNTGRAVQPSELVLGLRVGRNSASWDCNYDHHDALGPGTVVTINNDTSGGSDAWVSVKWDCSTATRDYRASNLRLAHWDDKVLKVTYENEVATWHGFTKGDEPVKPGDQLQYVGRDCSVCKKGEILELVRLDAMIGMDSNQAFLVRSSTGNQFWEYKKNILPYGEAASRLGFTGNIPIPRTKTLGKYSIGDRVVCIHSPIGSYTQQAGIKVGDVYTIADYNPRYLSFSEKSPNETGYAKEIEHFGHVELYPYLVNHQSNSQTIKTNNNNGTATSTNSEALKVRGPHLVLSGEEGRPGQPIQSRRGKIRLGG